jgi:hypothetical protein
MLARLIRSLIALVVLVLAVAAGSLAAALPPMRACGTVTGMHWRSRAAPASVAGWRYSDERGHVLSEIDRLDR